MHPADQLKKLLGFNFGIETVNSIHKTDFFGKSSGITAIEGDPAVFPGILLVSDILYSFIVFQFLSVLFKGLTFLVFWCSADGTERYLVGYYSIANKSIEVERNCVSKTIYKKILQFRVASFSQEGCMVPAILIGQLGKNFADGNDTLIRGDELLKMAIDRIRDIQYEIGGKFTYVECEDKEKLLQFYQNNGFVLFGKRKLDKDETMIEGEGLMQLLKYVHTR